MLGRDGAPVRHGTFATAAERLPGVAAMGFDVLYLPPIHPIGRVNRKGRNNTLVARPGRRRLAVGDRRGRGRPRRDPPASWARWPTSARSSPPAARAGPGGRDGPGAAVRAGPPVGDRAPGVVHHPRRTARIAYAENPPKKYQDIYPLNFDNDPEGMRAEVLRVVLHWVEQGVRDLPGRQPAHQAVRLLALADRRGQGGRPGRAVPGRGVHPAGDDARAGQDRLHPVLHVLHLADDARRDAGVLRGAGRLGRPHAAELLARTPRTSCTSTLQHGGPPMFKIRAVLASLLSPLLGHVRRLRAVRARGPPGGPRTGARGRAGRSVASRGA